LLFGDKMAGDFSFLNEPCEESERTAEQRERGAVAIGVEGLGLGLLQLNHVTKSHSRHGVN
jgi:hypothetical protein